MSNSVVELVNVAVSVLGITYLQMPGFSHLIETALLVELDALSKLIAKPRRLNEAYQRNAIRVQPLGYCVASPLGP